MAEQQEEGLLEVSPNSLHFVCMDSRLVNTCLPVGTDGCGAFYTTLVLCGVPLGTSPGLLLCIISRRYSFPCFLLAGRAQCAIFLCVDRVMTSSSYPVFVLVRVLARACY